MLSFDEIYQRVTSRKGGEGELKALLPAPTSEDKLATLPDDRALAEMTKGVFRAGFSWKVIEQKWPGFETAFLEFSPKRLIFETDEFWEKLISDKNIVRHGQKIMATRHNAQFILETAEQHGSFGKFVTAWPADNIIGLWDHLRKHGKRLGGMTGRYFLRTIGKDCFLPSKDVVLALRDAGLEIAENPTSKRDLGRIQEQINMWMAETGLSQTHISRILAMSIGENYTLETLRKMSGSSEDT